MQLWAIFDKLNGGSGVVNHNGQIVDYSKLEVEEEEKKTPIPPIEPPMPKPQPIPQPIPKPTPPPTPIPKENKGRKPKPKLTLKDLNIDIKSINLDDL